MTAAAHVNAQSESTASKKVTVNTPVSDPEKKSDEQMDTEESLKFVGNQLLFQLKKRLHLTDEEEEKEQEENTKKNKKLSFFGIEVERD